MNKVKILKADSPDQLAEDLERELEKGWEPVGGPFVAPFFRGYDYLEAGYQWRVGGGDHLSIFAKFCLMIRRTE